MIPLQIDALSGGRFNPLGLSLQVDAAFQANLYVSENPLLDRNFLKAGATFTVSPARVHGGPTLHFQPVSVFGIQVAAQRIAYFGTFGHLQTFSTATENWDDSALEARSKAKNHESGESAKRAGGWFLTSSAYVQAKAGPVVGKLEAGVFVPHLNLSAQNPYYYEPGEDLLVKNNSVAHSLNADVLLEQVAAENWRLGLSLRAFDARIAGQADRKSFRNVRAGPTILYTVEPNQTLALLVHWYLEHPNRCVPGKKAIPNVVLAYNSEFEFFN